MLTILSTRSGQSAYPNRLDYDCTKPMNFIGFFAFGGKKNVPMAKKGRTGRVFFEMALYVSHGRRWSFRIVCR